jgi:protein ImuA
MSFVDSVRRGSEGSRAKIRDELRRLLPRLESIAPDSRILAFGLPALDRHLPQGGLRHGALHEIIPETDADGPAAFGFVAALLSHLPPGPILLLLPPRLFHRVHGHGLRALGLEPARLILVAVKEEKHALWATEEALRSTATVAVIAAIEKLDFKTSQRLHLVAGETGQLLLLLRPARTAGASVALTRWRIGAAPAARDRFGLIARPRWRTRLERCRNGRPGQWLVEFDHAYGFSLAAALADPAPAHGTGPQPVKRTA